MVENAQQKIGQKETYGRTVPLLSDWMNSYLRVNGHFPQLGNGIMIATGAAVLKSVYAGQVSFDYVARSDFAPGQLEDAMQSAQTHHIAHQVDTETREVQHRRIWRASQTNNLEIISAFAGQSVSEKIEQWNIRSNLVPYRLNASEIGFLQDWFENPDKRAEVDAVFAMYTAGNQALKSDHVSTIAQKRRDLRNSHKGGNQNLTGLKHDELFLNTMITALVEPEIIQAGRRFNVSNEKVNTFAADLSQYVQ